MMERQICVTIDGKKEFYPEGIPYEEIAKNHQSSYKDPIILVMTDGKLRELHKRLRKDCMLSFITTADPIGHKTYKRSACLLLLKAIYDVAGKENLEKVVLHLQLLPDTFLRSGEM